MRLTAFDPLLSAAMPTHRLEIQINAHLILTTLSLISLAFSCNKGSIRTTRQRAILVGAALVMLPLAFTPLTTISLNDCGTAAPLCSRQRV